MIVADNELRAKYSIMDKRGFLWLCDAGALDERAINIIE